MNERELFVHVYPNVDSKLNAPKCAFHATFHKVYSDERRPRNLKFKQKYEFSHRHKHFIFTLLSD